MQSAFGASCSSDQLPIFAFVLFCHSLRGKALLESSAHFSSVQPFHFVHRLDGLRLVLDDEARDAVLDDLQHGAER